MRHRPRTCRKCGSRAPTCLRKKKRRPPRARLLVHAVFVVVGAPMALELLNHMWGGPASAA